MEKINIMVGSWNVAQGKATAEALRLWLGSVSSDVGLVVVGLQEVEMGAGFLAISAAKETVRYLVSLSLICCFVRRLMNYMQTLHLSI
jgi:hypothetical protein